MRQLLSLVFIFVLALALEPALADQCDDNFSKLESFMQSLPQSCKADADCEAIGVLSAPSCMYYAGLNKSWRTAANMSARKGLQGSVLFTCAGKTKTCDPGKPPEHLCVDNHCLWIGKK